MSLATYGLNEIKHLLLAIDSHLQKKVDIVVIGGTAALLAYKATRLTQDIDSFTTITAELNKAYELAKKETGLDIPMSKAGVADVPYEFESRLEKCKDIPLEYLNILIPEIHDYILIKTVRGYAHDLDVIEEVSKKNKVNQNLLIKRFETEMTHVTGDSERLQYNFASVLARCFGEPVAEQWMESRGYWT